MGFVDIQNVEVYLACLRPTMFYYSGILLCFFFKKKLA